MISNWRRLLPLLAEALSPLRLTDTHPVLARTAISFSLPPEILDLIVDHLHDEPKTLKTCCVVSKSWVGRTRTHLFATVEFYVPRSDIQLWKKAFPNPSDSPAHHTRGLSIRGLPVTTTTYADVGRWIRTFRNLVYLHLEAIGEEDHQIPLNLFRGLSPTLRSLSLVPASSEVLDLICSFPLLEDLALILPSHGNDAWNTPSTSPKLTGSLNLSAFGEVRPAVCQLLRLPDGLHFTNITIACFVEDVGSTMDLVSKCSHTLESLTISYHTPGAFPSASAGGRCLTTTRAGVPGMPPLDVSKATRLKDLSFRCGGPNVQRITMALETVQSKNLQQITIYLGTTSATLVGETVRQEWQDLDRLLLQFQTSHSIRPKITYEAEEGGNNLRDLAPSLLPELTSRGFVDLVENRHGPVVGPLHFIFA
jgi:hypothetical protein